MTEKDKLLQNLMEKSGKSQEELEKLINDKVNELSGLISAEGAIYIIANELGVRLESDKPKRELNTKKIEEITEPKEPVSLICKIIRKYDRVSFSSSNGNEGSVQSLLVGDDTGVIRLVFWNDKTDLLDNLTDGDILKISNAYTRENNNSERIEVHFGQYSDVEVNPSGIEITLQEYTPESVNFTEKKISDIEENDRNVKVSGIITDFDIPRFYLACPHTFKKVFQDEGKYLSPTHGEVEPIKVPIVNLAIDDGSSSIVTVGFRDRAEELIGANSEEIISLTENIDKYKNYSKKLVGSKVEIGGNVSLNNLTGEKQLLANQILSIEFKDVEEVAKELVEEDKKPEVAKEAKNEDLDIDIEEIDFDDDLM